MRTLGSLRRKWSGNKPFFGFLEQATTVEEPIFEFHDGGSSPSSGIVPSPSSELRAVVTVREGPGVLIRVRGMGGESVAELRLPAEASLVVMKESLFEAIGIPSNRQRLLQGSRELISGTSVADLGPNPEVHLLRMGMTGESGELVPLHFRREATWSSSLFGASEAWGETVETVRPVSEEELQVGPSARSLALEPSSSLRDVKRIVERVLRVPESEQRLHFHGHGNWEDTRMTLHHFLGWAEGERRAPGSAIEVSVLRLGAKVVKMSEEMASGRDQGAQHDADADKSRT
mmetsp:Transcript_69462/g.148603  ORF Transcript_69462/g.148603 Transcript_69462/m.148603 type:complete len:289 (+) Transcript_69462:137-1003(+)